METDTKGDISLIPRRNQKTGFIQTGSQTFFKKEQEMIYNNKGIDFPGRTRITFQRLVSEKQKREKGILGRSMRISGNEDFGQLAELENQNRELRQKIRRISERLLSKERGKIEDYEEKNKSFTDLKRTSRNKSVMIKTRMEKDMRKELKTVQSTKNITYKEFG
jgi:hypothetical protein